MQVGESAGAPTSLLRVKECLERGEIVGILADRSRGNERTVDVPFLGSPACFPLTPFRLATTLGVPIGLGMGLYRGGNRYSLHFERLDEPGDRERAAREDIAAVWLGRYVARLEHYCRLAPYNWFNFFPFWPDPRRG